MYQSRTQETELGASMEGSFAFVEGSLARPGAEFAAAIPRFFLRIPEYIF